MQGDQNLIFDGLNAPQTYDGKIMAPLVGRVGVTELEGAPAGPEQRFADAGGARLA